MCLPLGYILQFCYALLYSATVISAHQKNESKSWLTLLYLIFNITPRLEIAELCYLGAYLWCDWKVKNLLGILQTPRFDSFTSSARYAAKWFVISMANILIFHCWKLKFIRRWQLVWKNSRGLNSTPFPIYPSFLSSCILAHYQTKVFSLSYHLNFQKLQKYSST